MLRILDRYVIREILPPTLIALLIFTFLLQLPPVMQELERLVAKGVSWATVAHMLILLAPQGLGLTIPMALLVGVLIGLGRLSSDREAVALLACGVSPLRLLRPILLLAVVATAATLYVMIWAIPGANQRYREILYDIVAKKAESDIRPRVFFEDFPQFVIYPNDEPPPGQSGWKDILVAATTHVGPPELYLANLGRLYLDYDRKLVTLGLADGVRYTTARPGEVTTYRFSEEIGIPINPDSVFPPMELPPGTSEKTIPQLRESMARKEATGISTHPEVIAMHQKFSIPLVCIVFALTGLALGFSVARDSKFSGFVVGIAVIFAYYVVFLLAESAAKGQDIPAWTARWIPNVVLGIFAAAALAWRRRYSDGRLPFRVPVQIAWPRRTTESAPAAPRDHASATRPQGRKRGVVLIVRIPRLHLPAPSILDRYIARLYLRVAGLSFAALLGLFYISTFIDRSDKIFKGQAATGAVLELLVYLTPQFVYYIIPMAALLSVLVTFGLLSRNSELTVMKACGISLYRAGAALVVLALALSGTLFLLEQRVLAYANRRADALDSQIRGRPPRTFNATHRRWVLGRDGTLYHFALFDPNRLELRGLTIYRMMPDRWRLASQTYIPAARFVGGTWQGEPGWSNDFRTEPATSRTLPAQPLPEIEPPDYFATEQPLAEMMTVGQLRALIADLSASGLNAVPWMVELQRKLSFPFVTVVMTLLAIPFGVTTGGRGTLFGIGLGIVLALSYWILSSAFIAVGAAGVLPPVLAGWATNILGCGVAGYLLLRVRT